MVRLAQMSQWGYCGHTHFLAVSVGTLQYHVKEPASLVEALAGNAAGTLTLLTGVGLVPPKLKEDDPRAALGSGDAARGSLIPGSLNLTKGQGDTANFG
jgi:hypothetical protein